MSNLLTNHWPTKGMEKTHMICNKDSGAGFRVFFLCWIEIELLSLDTDVASYDWRWQATSSWRFKCPVDEPRLMTSTYVFFKDRFSGAIHILNKLLRYNCIWSVCCSFTCVCWIRYSGTTVYNQYAFHSFVFVEAI